MNVSKHVHCIQFHHSTLEDQPARDELHGPVHAVALVQQLCGGARGVGVGGTLLVSTFTDDFLWQSSQRAMSCIGLYMQLLSSSSSLGWVKTNLLTDQPVRDELQRPVHAAALIQQLCGRTR